MESKSGKQGKLSRRNFMVTGTMATTAMTAIPCHVLGGEGNKPPSEKLNIAAIGSGGMGAGNIRACKGENIVALCDVDDQRAAGTFKAYPQAAKYRDFRAMLSEKRRIIDAVIVATPDHTHAVATMMALKMKKHVFCQKPLTHTVYEARKITEAAREAKVQTQMGNQGHSSENIRLLYEWIRAGAIGHVREVHAWSDRPVGGQWYSTFPIKERPTDKPPIPETLDWDLWLGPVPHRPYHEEYCPFRWRGWLDFGTGPLGDMGCHILDPAFWALDLGKPDTWTVSATTTHWEPKVSAETYPRASIVRYEFPARGDMPPVKLTWYDGRLKPPIPEDLEPGKKLGTNGAIFLGDRGTIIHGSHGAGGMRIVPDARMKAYNRPPKTLPRVQGGNHTRDWVRACKDGKPASSNFDYGGPLTEMVLLGVLAMRVKDEKLQWDGSKFKFTNNDRANELLHIKYRDGWSL